jgi:hypothetical protein
MIINYKTWKDTIINNGIVTFSPFNQGVESRRYQLTAMDNQYDINYDNVDETFESIYFDLLVPLFNGDLPHGNNPQHAENIFVVSEIIDSLVYVSYTYAFDDVETAKELATIVDADDIYDNVDEDFLNLYSPN